MATLQEVIAKRKELQAQNPQASLADARNALGVSTISTPQTQNPPAVPPQQTTPPQTIKGVNGEQFQVAPVNPQTGLSQPAQTTPSPIKQVIPGQNVNETRPQMMPNGMSVSDYNAFKAANPNIEPTQEDVTRANAAVKPTQPTKTEAPIDYNVSAGREQEIQKNVADITQTNPNLLKDRNAYNQAFGYATADAGKRALLDSAFQGANQPMNQKDVLNAFISGVSVPEQNTQAYRNAKVQYDTFKKFNAMTPTQLLDNLKQGQIGSEMDSLLSQNPGYAEAKAKLSQAQRTASLNRMGQSALGVINGKEPEDLSDLSKVEAKYNAPPGTNVAAYEQYVTNNEDVKTAGTALHNIASQISDVTKTYNEALKSLKSQYGDMPASALITLMSTRTQDTKSLLDSLIDAKTLAQGDFDLAMKMAEGSYGAYTKDLAVQQGIEAEQRQMQNTLALSQAQYDQKIKQQAQALNDPTMAITSMVDEYKKLGIPFTRSTQQIIQDFQSSGQDLASYLTNLQKTIQSKPEYQAMSAYQMSQYAPKSTESWTKLDDTTLYNQITGETKNITTSSYINVPRTGNNVGQDTNNPGNIMGDTEAQRNIALGYGAIGFYKSPNGRTYAVFPDMESGVKASMEDLQAKISGGSSWATPNTSLEKFASGWVSGPNAPINQNAVANYVKLTGYSKNTPISQIPMDVLAKAVFANEGVDVSKSANISGLIGTDTQVSQASLPLYRAYMEDGKLPSKDALKGLGMTSEQFVDSAQTGYDTFLANKAKEINSTYPTLQVEFTPSYSNLSATQKEKLNESMTKIGDIDQRLEKLKALFVKSGTEVLPTKDKAEMSSLRQQIILKAKEVENLGVLNGPDLGILENIIPETTGIMSGLFSFDSNTLAKMNSIQENYRSDASTKGINYGTRITFKGATPTQTTQTNTGAGQISPQDLAELQKLFNQ